MQILYQISGTQLRHLSRVNSILNSICQDSRLWDYKLNTDFNAVSNSPKRAYDIRIARQYNYILSSNLRYVACDNMLTNRTTPPISVQYDKCTNTYYVEPMVCIKHLPDTGDHIYVVRRLGDPDITTLIAQGRYQHITIDKAHKVLAELDGSGYRRIGYYPTKRFITGEEFDRYLRLGLVELG